MWDGCVVQCFGALGPMGLEEERRCGQRTLRGRLRRGRCRRGAGRMAACVSLGAGRGALFIRKQWGCFSMHRTRVLLIETKRGAFCCSYHA